MRGPVWTRNRPTSLVGGGGQEGMGGDAGSHSSPGPGGWRGRQLSETQPRGTAPPKGRRPLRSAPFPEGRTLQPSSGARGAAGLQASRNPQPAGGLGAGTKPGPARASRLSEPGSIYLSRCLEVAPPRLAALPPPRPGRPPVPPRAYLVLDLGGEPVGRALVEVGHGCSDDRKGLRSESGSVTLGVPALSPQLWPRG